MRYERIRDGVRILDRSLVVSQTFAARLLYALLLACLVFDVPQYLPFSELAFPCLVALAIGYGIWLSAGIIPDGCMQMAAVAQQWPPRFRWVIHIAMLGATVLTPAAILAPLLVFVPSLEATPLRPIVVVLAVAGFALTVPLLTAGCALVLATILILIVWLPFMALRSIYRRYVRRRLPYEQYYRSREFR